MANESTLNVADIPLVARSIQTAVDNHMKKTNLIFILPNQNRGEKISEEKQTDEKQKKEKGGTAVLNLNPNTPKETNNINDDSQNLPPTSVDTKTAVDDPRPPSVTQTLSVKDNLENSANKSEDTTNVVGTGSSTKGRESQETQGAGVKTEQPEIAVQPATSTQTVVSTKATKTTEEKKRDKKKGNSKKGMSITVTSIKSKEVVDGRATGWDVQVRITATDITIISFGVERSKTVDETVKQLSNEIIKSQLIPEVLREKAEKLLEGLITRMFGNNFDEPEKSYPTQARVRQKRFIFSSKLYRYFSKMFRILT